MLPMPAARPPPAPRTVAQGASHGECPSPLAGHYFLMTVGGFIQAMTEQLPNARCEGEGKGKELYKENVVALWEFTGTTQASGRG